MCSTNRKDERVRVEVTSLRGTIRVKARVTEQIKPGVVFISFHFLEGAANVLTFPEKDNMKSVPIKVSGIE